MYDGEATLYANACTIWSTRANGDSNGDIPPITLSVMNKTALYQVFQKYGQSRNLDKLIEPSIHQGALNLKTTINGCELRTCN